MTWVFTQSDCPGSFLHHWFPSTGSVPKPKHPSTHLRVWPRKSFPSRRPWEWERRGRPRWCTWRRPWWCARRRTRAGQKCLPTPEWRRWNPRLETYIRNCKLFRCQSRVEWKGGRKYNRTHQQRNLRERPATKNLAEVFMELEPVREDSEHEKEAGKTEQHHCGHYAHSVPNLSSRFCYEAMERQTWKKRPLSKRHTTRENRERGNVHLPSAISEFEESKCRKT